MEEEHVETLKAMGFMNEAEIREALYLGNNDINQALSYLVNEGPTQETPFSEVDNRFALVETTPSSDSKSATSLLEIPFSDAEQCTSPLASDLAIFPVAQLVELEGRVFVDKWNIPYKREESLGRCLIAATRICRESGVVGLEASPDCTRFLQVCMKECFTKLLTTSAVNTWGNDIQEGVEQMVELLVELIAVLLANEPFPSDFLPLLSIAFNPESQFHIKNRDNKRLSNHWSFQLDKPAASGSDNLYVCNVINCFVYHGGFQAFNDWLASGTLGINELAGLLQPFGLCIDYLQEAIIVDVLNPAVKEALRLLQNVGQEDFKHRTNRVFDLLTSLRLIYSRLSCPTQSGIDLVDSMRLASIKEMFESAHFNSRMMALKEVTHQLEAGQQTVSQARKRHAIPVTRLIEWIRVNRILEKAMSNLDNAQYSTKLQSFFHTLGERVTLEEISQLWAMRDAQTSIALDNIHRLFASVAGVRFNEDQLTHFFGLVNQSWRGEQGRTRERLLRMIGEMGCEDRQGRVGPRTLSLLWDLAHQADTRAHIEAALKEFLAVVRENSFVRDTVRKDYIAKCVQDIKSNVRTYYILKHLMSLLKILSHHQSGKSEKIFLQETQEEHSITHLIVKSLLQYETNAISLHGDMLSAESTAQHGFTHKDYIQLHLDFLHYLLKHAELQLLKDRAKEIWANLITNSKACDFDREVCMDWFAKSISDLDSATQNLIFTNCFLKLEASKIRTETGFRCFRAYFDKVNTNEGSLKKPYTAPNKKWFVDKLDLAGMDYLWDICLFTPDDVIADEARNFLLEVSWTQVTGKPRKDPAQQHKRFFATCRKRLESLWISPGRVGSALRDAGHLLTAVILSRATKNNRQNISKTTAIAIERLLTIAQKYIEAVEQEFVGPRSTPCHGSTYRGVEMTLYIVKDVSTSASTSTSTVATCAPNPSTLSLATPESLGSLIVHTSERLVTLRERLWRLLLPDSAVTFSKLGLLKIKKDDRIIGEACDHQLLGKLGFMNEDTLSVTLPSQFALSGASASTPSLSTSTSGSTTSLGASASPAEEEHCHSQLPSQILSSDPAVYGLLLELGEAGLGYVSSRVNDLLQLLSSQPGLKLGSGHLAGPQQLARLTPFTRLYHLQVLSGSVIPVDKSCWWPPSPPPSPPLSADPPVFSGASLAPPPTLTSNSLKPLSLSIRRSPSNSSIGGGAASPSKSPHSPLFGRKASSVSPQPPTLQENLPDWLEALLSILRCHCPVSGTVAVGSPTEWPTVGIAMGPGGDEEVLEDSEGGVRQRETQHLVLQFIAFLFNPLSTPTPSPLPKPVSRSNSRCNTPVKSSLEPPPFTTLPSQPAVVDALTSLPAALHASLLQSLLSTAWSAAMHGSNCPHTTHSHHTVQRTPSTSRVRFSLSTGGSFSSSLDPPSGADTVPHSIGDSGGSDLITGDSPRQRRSTASATCTEECLTSLDVEVAVQSVRLLFQCVLYRPSLFLKAFLALPKLENMLKNLLVTTPGDRIRGEVADQLERLCFTLDPSVLHSSSPQLSDSTATFLQFVLKFVLFSRLPFWVNQNSARSTSLSLIPHCLHYFRLRGRLLSKLNRGLLAKYDISLPQMVQDECDWLLNFTPNSSHRSADDILLAGHLDLISSLCTQTETDKLTSQELVPAVDLNQVGQILIRPLLTDFLFSAARIIHEGGPTSVRHGADYLPKCADDRSRRLAYDLLLQLADRCEKNMAKVTNLLISLLHVSPSSSLHQSSPTAHSPPSPDTPSVDPSPWPLWDHHPEVRGRSSCLLVGLKNGGATCYMNAVIQQLFLQPGLPQTILAVDTDSLPESNVFFQMQQLFGHLLESRLDAYSPEPFWRAFKFWGEDINPREQQDAFDFFQALIDQLDNQLKKLGRESLFQKKYQGIFLDQKICQDCPHRYEREEAFFGLNLTVKTHDLVESLNQFVRGEVLEGDNAYLCEKCEEKRKAVKRLCLKVLPPVLCIQLKRFDFDWESQRAMKFDDYFSFPLNLDMTPYTSNAVQTLNSGSADPGTDTPSPSLSEERQDEEVEMDTAECPPLEEFDCPSSAPRDLYTLVGVVVHSGQANAGHYYSFIKDRRPEAERPPSTIGDAAGKRRLHSTSSTSGDISRGSGGGMGGGCALQDRWIKFNDTSVEEVEMTEQVWEQECFGGTFKVTGETARFYPEERHRYWNAYMLFYERVESHTTSPVAPKRYRKSPGSGSSGGRPPPTPHRSTNSGSFAELSELVHKGEKRGLFTDRIPAKIARVVREQNLAFIRDRDLYTPLYFSFVKRLAEQALSRKEEPCSQSLLVSATHLLAHFLLHTYLPLNKRSKLGPDEEWTRLLASLVASSKETCRWFIRFVSTSERNYLASYLLQCPKPALRELFAQLLEETFKAYYSFNGNIRDETITGLLNALFALLEKEAVERCSTSGQFFWLLKAYTQVDSRAIVHLFSLNAFHKLTLFLIGPNHAEYTWERQPRRWSSVQLRELASLHQLLSVLIVHSKLDDYWTEDASPHNEPPSITPTHASLTAIPPHKDMLPWLGLIDPKKYRSQTPQDPPIPPTEGEEEEPLSQSTLALPDPHPCLYKFLREVLLATVELPKTEPFLTSMVQHLAYSNAVFSRAFIHTCLIQCHSGPSGELRRILELSHHVILLKDGLRDTRLHWLVEGMESTPGLLSIISSNLHEDGRRCYLCMKTLVYLCKVRPEVSDYLARFSLKWEAAVHWLKSKMDDNSSIPSHPLLTDTSNDTGNTRLFHRTVSAQVTLQEATRILSSLPSPMDTDNQ